MNSVRLQSGFGKRLLLCASLLGPAAAFGVVGGLAAGSVAVGLEVAISALSAGTTLMAFVLQGTPGPNSEPSQQHVPSPPQYSKRINSQRRG
jgi:hypothetical protein